MSQFHSESKSVIPAENRKGNSQCHTHRRNLPAIKLVILVLIIGSATVGHVVEIVSGITGGEKVVTEGAVFVKLASNSGAIPEGHSHNH